MTPEEPKPQWNAASRKSSVNWGVLLLIVAGIAVGGFVFSRPDSSSGPAGDDSEAGSYLADYGGSRAVYERILTLSNCAALQTEFDTAAANNDAAEPGTTQHRQTTGYMSAADDRMRAIGCY